MGRNHLGVPEADGRII